MLNLLQMLFKNFKSQTQANNHTGQGDNQSELIDTQLSTNLQQLSEKFTLAPDLIVRHIPGLEIPVALVYLDSLVDKNAINNHIIQPLLSHSKSTEDIPIALGNIRWMSDWNQIQEEILSGNSVLFVDGKQEAYVLDTQGWPQRAIEDPELEASLRGGHQGFVETGNQNIALIRRYIQNKELKIKQLTLKSRSKFKVSALYLQDVANPDTLQVIEKRVGRLNLDNIINTGELAELIEDNSFSPFPQFILTERPDTAASHIMQGRFVLVLDRSPCVLVGPVSFISFFQSVDDYSIRWLSATFIRLLRFFAAFIALFLPAAYISFISFNYEVIPIQLILSVAESRERVPFHPFLEAMIMEITLELMREAGIRLPSPIGQTVGLVGGIIVGQTAVQTGIVSNIMVIVVAFTAIASFVIPNYDMGTAIRLMRFPMMLIAFMFGIVGIIIGAMIIVAHLVSLQSLGTAYGSPFAPVRFGDWKDTIFRSPLWTMIKRPKGTKPIQENRQEDNTSDGERS